MDLARLGLRVGSFRLSPYQNPISQTLLFPCFWNYVNESPRSLKRQERGYRKTSIKYSRRSLSQSSHSSFLLTPNSPWNRVKKSQGLWWCLGIIWQLEVQESQEGVVWRKLWKLRMHIVNVEWHSHVQLGPELVKCKSRNRRTGSLTMKS